MSPSKSTELKDLSWLLRYSQHCGVALCDADEPMQSLRLMFTKATWRVLCRSERDDFIPILANQRLSFKDLGAYCQALVEFGWTKAPSRTILAFVITESYLYYDRRPSVPKTEEKFIFMRLAQQNAFVTTSELALVRHWQTQMRMLLKPQMSWSRLVARAKLWRERERVRLTQPSDQRWHFYCRPMPWRGYEIMPLDTPLALLDEAVVMGTCLYSLRYLCCRDSKASRFFSLRKQGRRVATFELTLDCPRPWFQGWDLRYGRWTLQDSRLSFNRLIPQELAADLLAFAALYNLWSKRPARQPVASNDTWFTPQSVSPAARCL
jgi:hypothetical protein